jgi:hypothetical protein
MALMTETGFASAAQAATVARHYFPLPAEAGIPREAK